MQHAAEAAGEAVAADGGKVMHGDSAADAGIVFHMDVPSQQSGVGHDDPVADATVVGNMAAGHDEAIIPQEGQPFFFFGATVDRNPFANDVAITDDEFGFTAAIADVLWITPQDGTRKDAVPLTNADEAGDMDSRCQMRSSSDPDARTNRAERTDLHILGEFGSRIDDRMGMDVRRHGITRRYQAG